MTGRALDSLDVGFPLSSSSSERSHRSIHEHCKKLSETEFCIQEVKYSLI